MKIVLGDDHRAMEEDVLSIPGATGRIEGKDDAGKRGRRRGSCAQPVAQSPFEFQKSERRAPSAGPDPGEERNPESDSSGFPSAI